jgi:hypothetical protein
MTTSTTATRLEDARAAHEAAVADLEVARREAKDAAAALDAERESAETVEAVMAAEDLAARTERAVPVAERRVASARKSLQGAADASADRLVEEADAKREEMISRLLGELAGAVTTYEAIAALEAETRSAVGRERVPRSWAKGVPTSSMRRIRSWLLDFTEEVGD